MRSVWGTTAWGRFALPSWMSVRMTLAAPGGRGGGVSVGILRIMRRGAASSDSNVILTDTGGDGPPADAGAKASVARVFASDALGRDEPISMRNTTDLGEMTAGGAGEPGRRRRAREARAGDTRITGSARLDINML